MILLQPDSSYSKFKKKMRKKQKKSLCLPSEIHEIFMLPYFSVFWPENACAKFLTRSQAFVDSTAPFSYMGSIVLATLYCNVWSLTKWKVQQKL